jgi:hypothetical protein
LLLAAHLEAVDHQSIIFNQDELLREVADVYLGRDTSLQGDTPYMFPENYLLFNPPKQLLQTM